MSQENGKSPASELYELSVKHGFPTPKYELVGSKTGTHQNEFHMKVIVGSVSGTGTGSSKQIAKQHAAGDALVVFANQGLYDSSNNSDDDFGVNETGNFIGQLIKTSTQLKLPSPDFNEVPVAGSSRCSKFAYECKIGSLTTQATARIKQQAKQLSAKFMLEKIEKTNADVVKQCGTADVPNCSKNKSEAMRRYKKYMKQSTSSEEPLNWAASVENFTTSVKRKMEEKHLSFGDFEEEFKLKNRDGIDLLCNKLGIEYTLKLFQKNPPISCIELGLDSPFTILASGATQEDAEANAIEELYSTLEVYMSLRR